MGSVDNVVISANSMAIKPPATVTFQGIVPAANPPVNCTIQCEEMSSGRVTKTLTDNNCYLKHHFNENFEKCIISIRLDYASLYGGYKVINVTRYNDHIGN